MRLVYAREVGVGQKSCDRFGGCELLSSTQGCPFTTRSRTALTGVTPERSKELTRANRRSKAYDGITNHLKVTLSYSY
jgi:hypothetical protein